MVTAFIGIGSNLGESVRHVQTAMEELDDLPDTRLGARSSLYRSAPHGPVDQPDFVNAVVRLETELPAGVLLEYAGEIEQLHGRKRTVYWGPRTLDLDLLLYGNMKICEENLIVPHPRIAARNFVLYPLLEIAPGIEIPGLGLASELLKTLPETGLHRIDVTWAR